MSLRAHGGVGIEEKMCESDGKVCRLKLCGDRGLTRSRIDFIALLDGARSLWCFKV